MSESQYNTDMAAWKEMAVESIYLVLLSAKRQKHYLEAIRNDFELPDSISNKALIEDKLKNELRILLPSE